MKTIEHILIWTHLAWTIGLLYWRLAPLTPTRVPVSTAVQIRLTHSSSAAQHGSSGKAPTYALRPKHIHVFETSFTVLYFPKHNRFWHDRQRLKFTAWKFLHYDPEERDLDMHILIVGYKHHTFTINNKVEKTKFKDALILYKI